MGKLIAIILKVFGGITATVAVAGIMFGVFRFLESTKKTNASHEKIIQSLDSTKKVIDAIYLDVGEIKKEFVLFQREVSAEINAHEQSYKSYLSRYTSLNIEQYATLTDELRGLQDDIKKNDWRTPLELD